MKIEHLNEHRLCSMCSATFFTVISGSFRKHLPEIMMLKEALIKHHVAVLSPAGEGAINPGEEFIILDSDPIDNPKLLQDSVFTKIRRSTFLVVANIDGYLGRAAVLEIGYALALGITVYALEPIEDPNLKPYCRPLSEIFPDIKISRMNNIQKKEALPLPSRIASIDIEALSKLKKSKRPNSQKTLHG